MCNIPTYGTAAVGQFAIALLLEICHHVGHHDKAVHEGRWENNPDWCFWDYPLIELDGKVMGIIGFGRIGQATARIAQALGMKILAYDAYRNPALESETASMLTWMSYWRSRTSFRFTVRCFLTRKGSSTGTASQR